jgi:lipid-A-disaccharide synthase
MKYYLVAGERSGDLHGGNLIREIHQLDSEARIRCWGGDAMEQAGGELVTHYRDMAFMGFLEVIKNLRTIRTFLKICKRDMVSFQPDAVVLIDYPGFNLRIAKFAKQQGWPVYYYIAPKTWAWNAKRTHKLRKYVDRVFSILPFEEPFFREYGVDVTYVGNPLLDAINNFQPDSLFRQQQNIPEKPIIALLPGSRKQEILNVLSIMLEVVPRFPEAHFVVAAVGNLPAYYYNLVRAHSQVSIVTDQTYQVLNIADLAIVTSGTATLETALFNVPQIVVYKTSTISYRIAKALIRVSFISLVNLIIDREVVPELIQKDFSSEKIVNIGKRLLEETEDRKTQLHYYQLLRSILGKTNSSSQVAQVLIDDLQQ